MPGNDSHAQTAQPETLVGGHLLPITDFSDTIFDFRSEWNSCVCALQFAPLQMSWTHGRAGTCYKRDVLLIYGVPWLTFWILIIFHDGSKPIRAFIVLTVACYVIIGAILQTKLRHKYKLRGSVFQDLFLHAVCTSCAIAQEARHVDRDMGLIPIPEGLARIPAPDQSQPAPVPAHYDVSAPRGQQPDGASPVIGQPGTQPMMAPFPMQQMYIAQPMYQPQPMYITQPQFQPVVQQPQPAPQSLYPAAI